MKTVDVFPAIIKLAPPNSIQNFREFTTNSEQPEGTRKLDRCRVVIVDEVALVAVDSPEGPQVVFRERVVDMEKTGINYSALTETGKILSFRKDNNCGCGSRLRGWQPYKHLMS